MSKIINIDIVCPVYKNFDMVESLYLSLFSQEKIIVKNVIFSITDDGSDLSHIINYCVNKNIIYFVVKKNNFSHSLTREKAIKEYCKSNIVVMLSQDVIFKNTKTLFNLVESIQTGESVYNYSKQECNNKSIEKYIREKNYPSKSYIIEKKDIDNMQLRAFFASDACSAYNREVFIKVGGYGGYDVMMSEDLLYSKIILDAGYRKRYCADSIVYHSHKYTLKQLYHRYYDTGVFFSKTQIFSKYNASESGFGLAFYVLLQAIKHFDIPVLLRWLPDMSARYFGMRRGKKQ